MAKKSAVQTNLRRQKMVKKYAAQRTLLKEQAEDRDLPAEERFRARMKLAELPRNSSKTRLRNRCDVSGRPRAYYRRFRMSRIALRELGSTGQVPGLVKASW